MPPTESATVEHFTDPLSPWCWAAEPTLRRLRFEFDDLTLVPRTTVLLPDPLGGEEADALRDRFREAAAASGMPVAGDLWPGGVPSSRPACLAVAFVREAHPESALPYLRAVREAAFAEGRSLDAPSDLAALAERVDGLDPSALRAALDGGRAREALSDDLDRGREVAGELASADVRGDVGTLPLRARIDPDERNAGEGDGDDGDGDEDEAEDGDGGGPRIVAPPAVRFDVDPVVIADPTLAYTRLASALGRSVPRTGIEIEDQYGTGRMAMHVSRDVAEALSSKDFTEEVRPYVERFGSVAVAEIVAGTGVSPDTCRRALRDLAEAGVVERVGTDRWRTVHT